ncbi:MAG TPA: hypothetical protein VH914_13785 [Acidimicrobiia bacterium]|nr:hypothetical protein [Acidimicrobiia bacterium]
MKTFLLVYDVSTGTLVDRREMDADAARARRLELEKQFRDQPNIEVVVLSSDSLDTLKRTHSRYFKTVGELAS